MARNRRGLGAGEDRCQDGDRDVEYRAAGDEAAGDGKKIKNMEKETRRTLQSIAVVAQGIADTANALSISECEDVQDTLMTDLKAKFDELESLILEI